MGKECVLTMKVIKRDGTIVEYNAEKIKTAIKKANNEVSKKQKATDEEIDEIIKNSLINWTIDRVSKVNLTIVRLAIAEMLYINDVPEVVAINEAIELTKKYSDDKSSSFINGVLDKILKTLEQ